MSTFYENREDRYFIGEMTHWPVPVHVHDLVEILVLERGSAVLSIDGEARHLGPGDAALIFPLVPHAYLELSPDRAGLVAIFPAGLVAEYAGTFQTMLPERTVLPAEELGEETRYAVRCLREASQENSLPSPFCWGC